jgi:hypothetical protein
MKTTPKMWRQKVLLVAAVAVPLRKMTAENPGISMMLRMWRQIRRVAEGKDFSELRLGR